MLLPFRFFTAVCVIALTSLSSAQAQRAPVAQTTPPQAKDQDTVEITAEGGNTFIGDIGTADGNVVLKSGNTTLYADHLIYDRSTHVLVASGNVRLYGDRVYRGDHLTYNLVNKAITSDNFISQEYPKYIGGKNVTTPEVSPLEDHYRIKNGFFTTSDRANPTFRLQATTVEYRPNNDVVMKNVLVYVGTIPVFYIPIYVQSLIDSRPAYQFELGNSSNFGYFINNQFNFVLSPKMRGTVEVDYRSKRGIAGGLNLQYYPAPDSDILLKTYYAQDNLYSASDPLYPGNRGNFSKNSVYDGVRRDNRYDIEYQHHLVLGPDIYSLADIGLWSDPFVTRDFFPGEYQQRSQPDAVAALNQYNSNFNITLLVRADPNPFFEQVNRLPELTFDVKQQKVFNSPVEYMSESSVDYLQRHFASVTGFRLPQDYPYYAFNNPNYPANNYFMQNPQFGYDTSQHGSYSAYRYDTYHEFSYPQQYFNFLSVTPHIGGRFTYYSDDNQNLYDTYNNDGQGYDAVHNPKARLAGDIGLDTDFKISRTWQDLKSPNLGIDGIRHVIEPFVNTQFAPSPTVNPNDIRPFDERLISDQLQPINYPDYNSVDSIDKQAVVRLGVNNEFQTRRNGGNFELFDLSTYLDADLDHNFSAPYGNTFSDLFNKLTINPFPNITFSTLTALNIDGNGYNEAQNTITWQPDPSFRITAGEYYINHSVLFSNSNQATLGLFYRLNEHWQFETSHQFEVENSKLQLQSYTVYRDLESWILALNYSTAETNKGSNDNIVSFSLTLKAFPGKTIHSPHL